MSEEPILLSVPADQVFVTMRGLSTIVKDPAAERFYGVDLTDWLPFADGVQSATVTLSGIDAVDPDSNGDPTVVLLPNDTSGNQKIAVKLSGGTDQARATFTFTTTNGVTDCRRIVFLIRER